MKKRVITIIFLLVLTVSVCFFTGCEAAQGSYMNPYPKADCIVFTGYSDDFGTSGYTEYYYDKDTNVMYAYTNSNIVTPLYKADGTLVTYDEWLSMRVE